MRDLGPGHDLTPGTVARELGGRSSGAVGNAMARMTEFGVLVMTSEAPVKYALSPTAPVPSGEVAAYMAQRQTAAATDTTTDGAATPDTATGDVPDESADAPATAPADTSATDTTPADEVTDGTPDEADRPADDEADSSADDEAAALVAV